ncbi:hypothetical protein CVU75_02445 [Candidatus Dependentiae bacterium HGW-Dependentiae-1]|nr:MAG: hypothetical protein CVU75_02445 [Candidatus Dependentiae bacterium HGW-Dependentiae-1]
MMKLNKRFFLVLFLLVSVGPAVAKTWHTPQDELVEQRQHARNDVRFGELLFQGDEGEPDYVRAVTFLVRAVAQDVDLLVKKKALVLLGKIYYQGGYGVEQDKTAAVGYFEALVSLDTGSPDDMPFVERSLFATAYYYLAKIAYEGDAAGVQDWSQAHANLELALLVSPDGDINFDVQVLLARLFLVGHETLRQNLVQASRHVAQAYEMIQQSPNYFSAEKKAEVFCMQGDLARVGVSDLIEKNYESAFAWYTQAYTLVQETSLRLRYTVALQIAQLFLRGGYNLQRDDTRAIPYLTTVDAQDLYPELRRSAQAVLCTIYFYKGNDLSQRDDSHERDVAQAITCYTYVTQHEHDERRCAQAFLMLGDLYLEQDNSSEAHNCYIQVLELMADDSDDVLYTGAYERATRLMCQSSENVSEQEYDGASESGYAQEGNENDAVVLSEQSGERESDIDTLESLHIAGASFNNSLVASEHESEQE